MVMRPQWTGLTQQAIGRDLERARSLLSRPDVIPRDQRQAVARHLVWMAALLDHSDATIALAGRELDETAQAYFRSGSGTVRSRLEAAIAGLYEALRDREVWVSLEMMPLVARQAHWLVDGMDARATEHLTRSLMPRSAPGQLRMRAEVYRFRKQQMWSLAPVRPAQTRQPVGAVR